MNELFADKKKFLIVCDKKTEEYADFLLQLMKDKKDKMENVSGGIWNEKLYNDNISTISNEQYVLFLGNSKLAKRKRKHIKTYYSKYGIVYGWRGTTACLFVEDEPLETDNYTALIEESKKYDDLLEYKNIALLDESKTDELDDKEKKDDELETKKGFFSNISNLIEKGKNIDVDKISSQVTSMSKDLTNTSSKLFNAAKIRFYKDNIIEHQYSFAIAQFYYEGLKQFLEL